MKKSVLLIAALINIGAVSTAIAAQDQALIQETRKNQLAHDGKESSSSAVQSSSAVKKPALPLDHGPRAVATPWENQQRKSLPQEQGTIQSSEKGN